MRGESKAAPAVNSEPIDLEPGFAQPCGRPFLEPGTATGAPAQGRPRRPRSLLFEVPLPPAPYLAHPYPLLPGLTGRVPERQMLTRWLLDGPQPVLALIAPTGMGKSALAWAWLRHDVLGEPLPGVAEDAEAPAGYRVPDERRPEGVIWWSFSNPHAGFASFLDRALFYVSDGLLEPDSIAAHTKGREVVEWLQHRRLLVVLDGLDRELRADARLSAAEAEDPGEGAGPELRTCADPEAGLFLRRLAGSPLESRVLITSRLLPAELDDLAGCRREELSALSPDEALAFLRSQGLRGTPAELEAVRQWNTGHPLALRLWAGMIAHDPDWPVRMLSATRYRPGEGQDRPESAILALAYKALPAPLRALLGRMAVARSALDYALVARFSPFSTNRQLGWAMRELARRGLILFHPETGQYDLPPMVRAFVYRRLALPEREEAHRQLQEYYASRLASIPDPPGALEDLAPAIELYHHTVCLGQYDQAAAVFLERLRQPLHRLGAHRLGIDLLQVLFPRGEVLPDPAPTGREAITPSRLPNVREPAVQAQVLYALADFSIAWGQPRQAIPFLQVHHALQERRNDPTGLALGLEMLAEAQWELGELAEAERNWQRVIRYSQEIGDRALEARVRARLGGLLGYRGAMEPAERQLDAASAAQPDSALVQTLVHLYRAELALMRREAERVVEAIDTMAQWMGETASEPVAGDAAYHLAWTCWLLGAAHLILGNLSEAEAYLHQASDMCHESHQAQLEPDILLAWAHWYQAKGDRGKARERAEEALSLASRSEYRLKEAEIHNALGRWALQGGDLAQARQHAEAARERAWCDGPPYCYEHALAAAERLLKLVGSR